MDKEYFLGAGISSQLHFEPSPMPYWKSLASVPELNCSPEQPPDCFLSPNLSNLESSLSSMAASTSAVSVEGFAIPEFIGKLGNICNSGDISAHSNSLLVATVAFLGGGNNSNNPSYHSRPLNSPPKLHLPPIEDNFGKESLPSLGKSVSVNPNLPAVSADAGFADRAAKYSSLGSRSFNERTSQSGLNTELQYRSSPLMGSTNLPRISSSPSLKASVSPMGAQENRNPAQTQMEIRPSNGTNPKFGKMPGSTAPDRTEFSSPNQGSSVSEQIPYGETGLKTPSDYSPRKRKGRGKSNATKAEVEEAEDDQNAKRCKSTEGNESENGGGETGEEAKMAATENPKPPEPQKDYIHVRARRGQATDSHSLAERVRREKIGERMKLLQDLVPGCNKVTGKALMLDEIINYVQSLQRQVEFLSMKLASVDTRLEFNMDSHFSKDASRNGSTPRPTYPLDSSASPFSGHRTREIPQEHINRPNGAAVLTQCSVDLLCQDIGLQLPLVDQFGGGHGLPQFDALCEDDLQSIVKMGFGQNPSGDTAFHSQIFSRKP